MTIQASIVFLGTGQGSFVVGKNILGSGGFVLQVDENQFHVDPGPNALMQAALSGVNLRANTGILVSHGHLHHANDVNAVIDAMTYGGLDKTGVLIAPSSIVHGGGGEEKVLTSRHRDFLEKIIIMQAGQRVGVNNVEIYGLPADHGDTETIGFKFFTPYFSLAYSSDTVFSKDMVEAMKNSNILILNVPNLVKEAAGHNLCVADAIKIIEVVHPELAILTHFGREMVEGDSLYQIRQIQKATGVQTIAARDGMVINPLSYAVDKGQRTLGEIKETLHVDSPE